MTCRYENVESRGWVSVNEIRREMGLDRQSNKDCRNRVQRKSISLSLQKQRHLIRQKLLRHQFADPVGVIVIVLGHDQAILVKKLQIQSK